jgi:hypothetical protein
MGGKPVKTESACASRGSPVPAVDGAEARITSSATSVASAIATPRSARSRASTTTTNEMTRAAYDTLIASRMSEETWRQHVRRLANPDGVVLWPLTYHTLRSKGSDPGWPDECFGDQSCRRLLLMELKRQAGRLTSTQAQVLDWLARFRDAGNYGLEVYGAVRPLDREAVLLTLQGIDEDQGGLHQWCLLPGCQDCTTERRRATSRRPAQRLSRRKT